MKMIAFAVVALAVFGLGSNALLGFARDNDSLWIGVFGSLGLAMALGLWWWRSSHE